jgi:hypothetical protein
MSATFKPFDCGSTFRVLPAKLCRESMITKKKTSPTHVPFIPSVFPPSSSAPSTHLTTESVKGAALSLEGVDNVEGGDSLALGVLSVGDGVADNTLEEGL